MTSSRASIGVAVAALLVGAVFLRDLARDPSADPTVSADNGAPAGLLALRLLLEERGREVALWRDFDTEPPSLQPGSVYVVPPPSLAGWTEEEADALIERVRRGERLIVLCDEQEAAVMRQRDLLRRLRIRCHKPASESDGVALGTTPLFTGRVDVSGAGRVSPSGARPSLPLVIDGTGAAVVLAFAEEKGAVFAAGTATIFANDGLPLDANAALLLSVVGDGGRVLIDERHHGVRGQGALQRAFSRTGPKVSMLALLLLVPVVLLGVSPRRGDPPPAGAEVGIGSSDDRLDRLAALYERVARQANEPSPLDPAALHQGPSPHERNGEG